MLYSIDLLLKPISDFHTDVPRLTPACTRTALLSFELPRHNLILLLYMNPKIMRGAPRRSRNPLFLIRSSNISIMTLTRRNRSQRHFIYVQPFRGRGRKCTAALVRSRSMILVAGCVCPRTRTRTRSTHLRCHYSSGRVAQGCWS